jgi:hypothetical protein
LQSSLQWRGQHRVAQPQNKKRNKKMNGLIKQSKLEGLNQVASFAIAFFGVIAVVYMFVGTSV